MEDSLGRLTQIRKEKGDDRPQLSAIQGQNRAASHEDPLGAYALCPRTEEQPIQVRPDVDVKVVSGHRLDGASQLHEPR